VARALENLERTSLSTGLETLHRRALINEDLVDDKFRLVEGFVFLVRGDASVGNGRCNELEDGGGRSLRGELEDRECFFNTLSTNHLDDTASLLRCNADVLELGDGCNHDVPSSP
jgi:hypothetical protein